MSEVACSSLTVGLSCSWDHTYVQLCQAFRLGHAQALTAYIQAWRLGARMPPVQLAGGWHAAVHTSNLEE